MKKLFVLLLAAILLCGTALAANYDDVFTKFDQRDNWTEAVIITFNNDGVLVNGSGVSVDGTTVYITAAGTYLLSGECQNGQIVMQMEKTEKAQLVLSGLTLTCVDSAPLYVISADKVSLTLAPNTVNTLTDGAVYTRPFDKAPKGCICARDDLTINGTGALIVNGNYNNGIDCSNDLKIVSGAVTVTAKKNALKGDDSVAIKDGAIILDAGKDGIKADNADEAGKGYVYVAGGSLDITAGDDAIQGQQDVTVKGGVITVDAQGKTINSKGTQEIASGVISKK